MTNGRGYYIIDPLSMRSWRNWQTRKTKDLVANTMQVQFLSTAPFMQFAERKFSKLLFLCLKMNNYYFNFMILGRVGEFFGVLNDRKSMGKIEI